MFMSKSLYLIRHAHAEDQIEHSDKDRHLTPKGKGQCESLSQLMAERSLECDLAIVSTARRTLETFENMDLDIPKVEEERLYTGGPEDYLEILRGVERGYSDVMLIGHNPTCAMLSVQLAQAGAPNDLLSLRGGFRKGQLAVFHFDVEDWSDIQPRSAFLSEIILPEAC